jgi:hypothetical protein
MWVAEENGRDRNEPGGAGRRDGLLSAILGASARLLEAEHDRWILWVPVRSPQAFSPISCLPTNPLCGSRSRLSSAPLD